MTTIRVGIRCDAGQAIGVGHLVRCVALAEELTARGAQVHFLGDLGGLSWAHRQLDVRRLPLHTVGPGPADLVAAAGRLRLDAVVLDSYQLDPACAAALRADGRVVFAVVDGDTRGQVADGYVDQNLDAEASTVALPAGAVRLAGLRYVLLRDAVRRLRPRRPRPVPGGRPPRVVCFFGGTDACGAAPVLSRMLIETGEPFEAVVVAGSDAAWSRLHALRPAAAQRLTVIRPTDDLPALLADADVVISASGTSTWELFCLGVPAALVWVADNQLLGYRRVMARRMAAGLGRLQDLREGSTAAARARSVLRELLVDADLRAVLAGRAWAAVDGRGRERVADELVRRTRLPGATEPVTAGRG